jgi:class 3 adenylate cyclase
MAPAAKGSVAIRRLLQGSWFSARLSRRIAFWIFLNFLLVEGIVLVPSVLRRAERLSAQLRQLTHAKIEWLVDDAPQAAAAERLAAVARLRGPGMVGGIQGAVLYRASSGERLGGFGAAPRLSLAAARERIRAPGAAAAGRWFPLDGTYEGVWGPATLQGDQLLIVRHHAGAIHSGLLEYFRNIALIVLAIAAVLTLTTMLVVQRLVITPVLTLRQRLEAAGAGFERGGTVTTAGLLLPETRPDELGDVERAFNASLLRTHAEMERRRQAEVAMREERDRAETLLLNILPAPIAAEMKSGRHTISRTHPEVSVLFADIVGFSELTGRLSCHELVSLLNRVFSAFDGLCERYGLEKIKTIGDNYMAVSGLPEPQQGHAGAAADLALAMQQAIGGFPSPAGGSLALRIGIASGPVVAGVIGRRKFIYDLWGGTVNLASRMESNGVPGRIQVSEATRLLLPEAYHLEPRGSVPIKGAGEMVTWWLVG